VTAFVVEVIAHGLGTAVAALALIIATRLALANGSGDLVAACLPLGVPLTFLLAFLIRVPTRRSLRRRFGLSPMIMSAQHSFGGIFLRRQSLERHPLPEWGPPDAGVYLPGVGYHYALQLGLACLVLVGILVNPIWSEGLSQLFAEPMALLIMTPLLAIVGLLALISPWLMFTRWDKPELTAEE